MFFTIEHNTNALIVRLMARVGSMRRKDVCPVISLVTDQGRCFLIKVKSSLSRNVHGTLYVKMEFVKNTPFSKPSLKTFFQSNTTTQSFLCAQLPLNVVEIIRLGFLKIPKIIQ